MFSSSARKNNKASYSLCLFEFQFIENNNRKVSTKFVKFNNKYRTTNLETNLISSQYYDRCIIFLPEYYHKFADTCLKIVAELC